MHAAMGPLAFILYACLLEPVTALPLNDAIAELSDVLVSIRVRYAADAIVSVPILFLGITNSQLFPFPFDSAHLIELVSILLRDALLIWRYIMSIAFHLMGILIAIQ